MKPIPKDQTPEYQLLCQILAEKQPNPELLPQVDWTRFTRMAQFEGVAPLMYHFLKSSELRLILPVSLFEKLKMSYFQTLAHNSLLFSELQKIGLLFKENNVPFIVLKGAALANTVYKNIGLRPMGDVDLLIERSMSDVGLAILTDLGFEPVAPELFPGHNKFIGYHNSLRKIDNPNICAELHWNLIAGDHDWREPKKDWFWDQKMNFHVEDKDIFLPVLSPEAHLVYLAAHMILKHGEGQVRLVWYYDLHRLIGTSNENLLDWQEIQNQVFEFDWQEPLAKAIIGSQRYMGTQTPENFLVQLNKKKIKRIEKIVKNKTVLFQTSSQLVWDSLLSNDWQGRIMIIKGHIFPSEEYMSYRYQTNARWLYPFFHIYRWASILSNIFFTLIRSKRNKLSK